MKAAASLREALNTLDPESSLRTPEELEAFFVERPESPTVDLQIDLGTDRPQKILFTGHRGSGKSTELSKLALRLKDEFFVVDFSIKDTLDLFDLNYVDVLLSIGLQLFRRATQEGVPISNEVRRHIRDFADEMAREVEHSTKQEQDVGADLPLFFAKFSGRVKQESATRGVIRRKVSRQLTDLFDRIALLAGHVRAQTGKRIVMIVDGLDKPDLEKAKAIFYDNAASLCEPAISIIYTFPSALRHDPSFQQIRSSFGTLYVLPNVKVRMKDGKPGEIGRGVMREMLLKRLTPDLIPKKTLDCLVACSSGVPRELIALARLSCIGAIKNKRVEIEVADVERAIQNRSNEYQVLLDSKQRELLRKVHQTKRIENDEEHRILLHSLAVIEFKNGDVWYDVNPLVAPLLALEDPSATRDAAADAGVY